MSQLQDSDDSSSRKEKGFLTETSLSEPSLRAEEFRQIAFDLLECFPLAFFAIDPEFRIRFCYGKAFRMAKIHPSALKKQSVLNFFEDRPDLITPIRKAMTEKQSLSLKTTWQGRFYSAHHFPVYDGDQFMGLHAYVFDHTDGSRNSLEFLNRSSSTEDLVGAFWVDEKSNLVGLNAELCELTGFSQQELERLHPFSLFSNFSQNSPSHFFGTNLPRDITMRTADGQFLPIRLQSSHQVIAGQNLTTYLVRSLRNDRAKDHALNESQTRFFSIADAAPLFITMTDEYGQFTYFNSQWLIFRGTNADEEKRASWPMELPTQDLARFRIVLARSLRQKCQFQFEAQLKRADGAKRWVHWKAAPRFTNSGEFAGLICTGLDITNQKNMYEGLMNSKKELERSNHELEQFAYVASHDLQEPLRVINSFADLLASEYADSFDDKALEYFRYITDSAQRMKGLISDILQYARVSAKDNYFQAVDLTSLAKEACESLLSQISASQAQIQIEDVGLVLGQPKQLLQVMQNLIENAIKYRKLDQKPEIKIYSKVLDEKFIKISVSDNGIGIPIEFHGKIFELFQRLHTQDELEGNGLGLSIVKKIIELHGGMIKVKNRPEGGTEFSFTLRRALP